MENQHPGFLTLISIRIICLIFFFGLTTIAFAQNKIPATSQSDSLKLKASLSRTMKVLPADKISNGRVSFLDETFKDWIKRTGELPPDFDKMPSIPFLPDPLIEDEGGKNIPVTTAVQWKEKRRWMKEQLEYYITGTYPQSPMDFNVKVLSEKKEGSTTLRIVELSFGPQDQAKLTMELMIPQGEGPFPVFMTQWNHRGWAQIAVRRGYMACVYAASDAKDDTEKYSEIWAGQYDFTRLMRRAFGTFRAIDYLHSLPIVDKDKIALSGHSRNGKLALMAAAFDERIKAVIPSSGGSGAEVPWRYATQQYDVEDIALLSAAQPSWLHPRLRFFIGRENKLPIDQNHFMALIAPRGLMLSTAINEGASNPWGIEQAYGSAQKVYKFLNAEDNLAIRFRDGEHGTHAGDIEDYIDFFDYVFKRSKEKPENKLFYNYTFEGWRERSKENINPLNYPSKGGQGIVTSAGKEITKENWAVKKTEIKQHLQWILGDEPPGLYNRGPERLENGGAGEDYFGTVLKRPIVTPRMGRMALTPYKEFGDYLYGYIYYPKDKAGNIKAGKLPALIYQHEYDYSKGFSSYHDVQSFFEGMTDLGYVVFSYDMIGFGNRIEEGTRFYDRYPNWSKMGKMLADVKGAVDAMSNLDFVDSSKILVAGYAMGATVGLYAAALDERIAGLVSVSGFTPMRTDSKDNASEGIKAFSHLHGLIPRLGFYVGHADRIPYDYQEILGSIAPRPVLLIAPQLDHTASLTDIKASVSEAGKIYKLLGAPDQLILNTPDDFNRFSDEMKEIIYGWAGKFTAGARVPRVP
ncbi:acetylxylan esterase [Daejeonella sp.]|uniref:glucuronyl esterase domain-containing protein n=1 Tax=Daejeonella sp. TaxID=2805397 RepID=UPI002EDA6028